MNELTGEAEAVVLPSLQKSYNQAVKNNTLAYIKGFI